MRSKGELYSEAEDAYLRAHVGSMSSRELATHLGRSLRSVETRPGKLRLRRFRCRPFTEAEDQAIRAGFGGSSGELGRQLGRDPAVIRTRAKRLGLGKWKRELRDFRGYKVSRTRDGKRVPEHRQVVEDHLGRRLGDDERVHHINCDKRDNRLENLWLCDGAAAHSRAHHSINGILAELLERGVIEFDRAEGVYRLCAIRK